MNPVDNPAIPLTSRQEELFPEYAVHSLDQALRGADVAPLASLRRPEQFLVLPQQESYSCGSACLRMVLQYYWIASEEETVRVIGHDSEKYLRSLEEGTLYKTEDQGIGSSGIISVLRHYRMRGFIMKGEHSGLENLAWFLARDIPLIVNWQCEHDGTTHPLLEQPVLLDESITPPVEAGRAARKSAYGHYSVAVGFSPGGSHLFLADPSGNVFLADARWFEGRWWDPTPTHSRWTVAVYRDGSLNREIRKLFRGLFI